MKPTVERTSRALEAQYQFVHELTLFRAPLVLSVLDLTVWGQTRPLLEKVAFSALASAGVLGCLLFNSHLSEEAQRRGVAL